MSAHTTLKVTRMTAMQLLMARILGDIDDKTLEQFMDAVLAPSLFNAIIVPDGSENNDFEATQITERNGGGLC